MKLSSRLYLDYFMLVLLLVLLGLIISGLFPGDLLFIASIGLFAILLVFRILKLRGKRERKEAGFQSDDRLEEEEV